MERKTAGEVIIKDLCFKINKAELTSVYGLPHRRDNIFYIVSRVVAEARRDRDDLIIPDETVRDGEGRIIGCRGFASVAKTNQRIEIYQSSNY